MQTTATLLTIPRRAAFPATELSTRLRAWWESDMPSDGTDPFARNPGTLFDLIVTEIDSLSVVSALLEVEDVVGFKLPASIVKRGGYRSCDEMVADLLPKIEKKYLKRNK